MGEQRKSATSPAAWECNATDGIDIISNDGLLHYAHYSGERGAAPQQNSPSCLRNPFINMTALGQVGAGGV